jgi:hypothetical protein
MKNLNQQKEIYFKGQLCTFIYWDTLTSKNEVAVKIGTGIYSVNIKSLKN